MSERMTKLAIELSEYDLRYQSYLAIKAQILADFLLECTNPKDGSTQDTSEQPKSDALWLLHANGSSNANGSSAGLVLTSPDGAIFEYGVHFSFPASNNEAEYEALLTGLHIAHDLKVKKLNAYTNSQLVASHVRGEFKAWEPNIIQYLQKVRNLSSYFSTFEVIQISRAENACADLLSRLETTDSMDLERKFYLKILEKSSITDVDQVMQIDAEPSWFNPISKYHKEGWLPANRRDARKLKMRASHYVLLDNQLYKRSFSMPLLKCVHPLETNYALWEVHKGICGSHLGG